MNIRRILPIIWISTLLGSCDFNEDYCIRDGLLVADADYSKMTEHQIAEPTYQHLIAYGKSNQTQPVSDIITFTEDTLRWKAPQGDYDFIFWSTEKYQIRLKDTYGECELYTDIERMGDKSYYAENLDFISTTQFSDKLIYQQPTYRTLYPTPFTQTLVIRLHLSGDDLLKLKAIRSELEGISTSKNLLTGTPGEQTAIVRINYLPKSGDPTLWTSATHVFGIDSQIPNQLTLFTETSNENDESFSIDLSSYLKGITDYKITIDLNLALGKKLELQSPIVIEDWETGDEIELW